MKSNSTKLAIGLMFAAAIGFLPVSAKAQETSLSITIKNKQFQPSQLRAPANKPIRLTIRNADSAVAEFESRTMRVEKIVPAGGTVVVNVKPLVPGTYSFFDDFNQANQGSLIVE